jgi:hypothetical protein
MLSSRHNNNFYEKGFFMQPNAHGLPSNLLSKFSRIYVAKNSFKDDSGKTVEYERLHLEYVMKGEPLTIEIKVDKDIKKDLRLLELADDLSQPPFGAPQE